MDWKNATHIMMYRSYFTEALAYVDPVTAHERSVEMVTVWEQTFAQPDNPDV